MVRGKCKIEEDGVGEPSGAAEGVGEPSGVGEAGVGEASPAARSTWARITPVAELLLLRALRYAERAAHAAGGCVFG